MRSELIPLYPNRPPVIKVGPEWVYVSMMDQGYFQRIRSFKRTLLQLSQEDPAQTGKDFKRALLELERYKRKMRILYWNLKLMPPDWGGEITPPPDYNPKLDYSSQKRGYQKQCSCGGRCSCHRRRTTMRN